ncbi:hypothetical protein [uncultured Roseobacter sp.]|uniref:hypothetical protein n=1 Tax=uncultured Roseobacter sp. TaxID=114847 RepID=UPI0026032EA0|nr:hypothetical protein [uncultured Roseobacter sp.]
MAAFFSNFLSGRALALSTTVAGVLLTSESVSTWGSSGGSGGTVSIVVGRSTQQVAPDSIRFTVDLSAATFDATETYSPVLNKTYTNNAYDPRLHDLIFLWDMGDTGDWTAPTNVLNNWKNKRYARGPVVKHCYTQPGAYTVKLIVIEPSSLKVVVAPEIVVNVSDPDTVFAGTNTICINPVGDSDFTGAPAGAQQLNSDTLLSSDTIWTDNRGTARQWLFKSGASFDVGVELDNSAAAGQSFGAYGSGARPILNNDGTQNGGRMFEVRNSHSTTGSPADVRIWGLDCRGGFDPGVKTKAQAIADGDAIALSFYYCIDVMNTMISDCRVSGFRSVNIGMNHDASDDTTDQHFHIDDTLITDFGGQYVIITEATLGPNSSFAATGTAIVQNVDAATDDSENRAPIRSNGWMYTHGRGCDLFHTREAGQPCWKVEENPQKVTDQNEDGHVVNIHSSVLEGGANGPMRFNGNVKASNNIPRLHILNAIIDGCILICGYSSDCIAAAQCMGVTMRNNLGVKLVNNTVNPGSTLLGWYLLSNSQEEATGDDIAPITAYQNTMLLLATTAEQTFVPGMFRDEGPNPVTSDQNEFNNIVHIPNTDTPNTPAAPLSEVALSVAPRLKGKKPGATFVLDASLGNAGIPLWSLIPQTGSSALGGATGTARRLQIAGFDEDFSTAFDGSPSVALSTETGYVDV